MYVGARGIINHGRIENVCDLNRRGDARRFAAIIKRKNDNTGNVKLRVKLPLEGKLAP